MPTSLGPAEILVILVVGLIVLGPKRLPEAGRQVGRFISEVRHWSSAVQAEIRDAIDTEGEPAPPPPVSPTEPLPVPTPQDLGPPSTPPGPLAPEASRRPAATEWGLAEPAPRPPPAPPSAAGIPAEWATPPSTNGDHSGH
jgi:Tat protein translocase TatB subunit